MAKPKQIELDSSKEENLFKDQYSNTGIINSLAGHLNTIVEMHIGKFKESTFYHRVQKLLRRAPSHSRILLLHQLKDMEVNTQYPSKRLFHLVKVVNGKSKIAVNLEVLNHAWPKKFKSDCYCYKIVMIIWDKTSKPPKHDHIFSDWVSLEGGKPEFDFEFSKPQGTTHWLLCIRQMYGLNQQRLRNYASESMYIADAGTFDKKEQELLEKTLEERSKKRTPFETESDDVKRVKPKKMR
jgi:hypothetical protein